MFSYHTGSTTELHFVWDDWNPVISYKAVGQAALVPEQAWSWGLDLSGTIHPPSLSQNGMLSFGGTRGAGGVGGLVLCVKEDATTGLPSATYFTAFDGNGNLVGLINAQNGNPEAVYEYGPFGELIRESGPMAKTNPFRFSTKFQDEESDLVYYGYRYYNPTLGRWLSRDPLGEKGGRALYSLVENKIPNYIDFLGLTPYGFFRVWLDEVDQEGEGIKGFKLLFELDKKKKCPCKADNIILVQSVDDPLYPPLIDATQKEFSANANGGIPIPAYSLQTSAERWKTKSCESRRIPI